jgi:hypothetical protein
MEYLPKHIFYNLKYNRYVFSRTIDGMNFKKTFRSLPHALEHLNAFNYCLKNNIKNLTYLFA